MYNSFSLHRNYNAQCARAQSVRNTYVRLARFDTDTVVGMAWFNTDYAHRIGLFRYQFVVLPIDIDTTMFTVCCNGITFVQYQYRVRYRNGSKFLAVYMHAVCV